MITSVADEAALRRTLDEVPRELFTRIVAIDDGLTTDARSRLEGVGAQVFALEGRSLFHVLADGRIAGESDGLVLFAADGRQNPRDLGRLVLALERGNDLVVASRFLPGGARHDRYQRVRYRSVGNRILTLLASLLFYGNSSDALSTFCAVRRRRLVEARLDEAGLPGHYQLSIQAMKRGWKVAEVPTVEVVDGDRNDWKPIVRSIAPLLRVLLKEARRS